MSQVEVSSSNVCVVGLGYVGLPAALLAAKAGHNVVGVDVNTEHIESLANGTCRFKEPGLQELLQSLLPTNRLTFSAKPVASNIYLIAVPTPVTKERKADLSYVVAATESIAPVLRKGDLVIVESTVSPGCCRDTVAPILNATGLACGKDYFLAYCPERVLPGKALEEIVHNARIVGGSSQQDSLMARNFYSTFVRGTIHLTGMEQAELVKLAENAYRDVNIAFANEVANICEQMNVEANEVINLANAHPRVQILKPGPGVGGHCIAVDPWFLIEACPDTPLLQAARHVNDLRPVRIIEKVKAHFNGQTKPKVMALGLSYKADVGDIRESPALQIATALNDAGMEVITVDPHVVDGDVKLHLRSIKEIPQLVSELDALLVFVDHQEFLDLDMDSLVSNMRGNFFLDTRGRLLPNTAPEPVAALSAR